MTLRAALAAGISTLVDLVRVAREPGAIQSQIEELDALFKQTKSRAFDSPSILEAERKFGEFKWLFGVNQRGRAIKSLEQALADLTFVDRKWQ